MKTSLRPNILILILFSCAFCLQLQATTITWNGGFGFWGQANRWSTGTVPGPDDYVIIQNGFVIIGQNFDAQAKGVEVSSNSAFRIEVNASLSLANGDIDQAALTNNGILFNFGDINLDGFEGINPNTSVGIVNNNHFRNFPAGNITIRNTNNKTINNYIDNTFINEGDIDIDVAYDIWGGCIQNLGKFENKPGGIILLVGGYFGISNSSLATHFKNEGKIYIKDCATAIMSSDLFHNLSSGSIQITDGQLQNTDYFLNDGVIHISDIQGKNNTALRNIEYLENYGSIIIFNVEDIGVYNHTYSGSTPVIDNYGYLMVNSNSYKSIFNEGYVFNFNTGWIESDNYLKGGDYINMGVMKNTNQGISHSITLENSGIFNDKYGKLVTNNTTNFGVIVRPIQGPITGGNYVYDALDLGNASPFTFGANWFNEYYSGVNCGDYNPGNNSLYPNIYAENDGELHAEITINSSGLGAFFDVIVLNPSNSIVQESFDLDYISKEDDLNVFPNPTSGQVQLEWNKSHSSFNQLAVFDAIGKKIYETNLNGKQLNYTFDLPDFINSGIYYMVLTDENGKKMNKKITVSK